MIVSFEIKFIKQDKKQHRNARLAELVRRVSDQA